MLKQITLSALVLAAIPAISVAAPIIVDDFSSVSGPIYPITDSSVGSPIVAPVDASAGAIGGSRQAVVELVSSVVPGLDSVQTGVFAGGPGLYDYNSTSGASGKGLLNYGTRIVGGSSLGLAIPAGSTLEIDFLSYDMPAGGSLLINVILDNGNISSAIGFSVTTPGAQNVSIPLDGLDAGVRSNVTGLGVLFAGSTAVDFRLNTLSLVIPEPSALGLLAPVGLLLARRRK